MRNTWLSALHGALPPTRTKVSPIPEMSQAEGVSAAYTAKLLRVLRKGDFVKAAQRGKEGGYTLAACPGLSEIVIGDVMNALGGRLFESDFCERHAGSAAICARSVDCSVLSLWRAVQVAVDQVLSKATLRDLLHNEADMNSWVRNLPGTSASGEAPAGGDPKPLKRGVSAHLLARRSGGSPS